MQNLPAGEPTSAGYELTPARPAAVPGEPVHRLSYRLSKRLAPPRFEDVVEAAPLRNLVLPFHAKRIILNRDTG